MLPSRPVLTLCIAEVYPWPPRRGYEIRLANLLSGLALNGPVDFVCLDASGRSQEHTPQGITCIGAPASKERSWVGWLPRWLLRSKPRRLVRQDFSRAREILGAGSDSKYDLIYYSHIDSWHETQGLCVGPSIIDLDNLEHLNLRSTRRLGPRFWSGDSAVGRLRKMARWMVASGFDVIDERRWDRIQRLAATKSAAVLVCSELDVERSNCTNAVVIPNGYQPEWSPQSHRYINSPGNPVFLFVGSLGYLPNADALQWFVSEIAPLIHQQLPGAQFRFVGECGPSVQSTQSGGGVVVVGPVPNLEQEFAQADVAIVPIRSGAGTRLKVVEAMANRLPVVSTSIGCEGIEVDHGVHVLIADSATSFASACLRLARESSERTAMIDAAEQRFHDRYDWNDIRSSVALLARSVVEQADTNEPPQRD